MRLDKDLYFKRVFGSETPKGTMSLYEGSVGDILYSTFCWSGTGARAVEDRNMKSAIKLLIKGAITPQEFARAA